MLISLIAAMSENRVIGRDGRLPWHLPADLARFKRLTMGHPIVMGRRTFESMGSLLPGRTNIILSRGEPDLPEGAIVAHDLDAALDAARATATDVCYIGGGGDVYRLALPRADRIDLTVIHAVLEGDVTFPDLDESVWRLVERTEHPADERHAFAMSFESWERRELIQ